MSSSYFIPHHCTPCDTPLEEGCYLIFSIRNRHTQESEIRSSLHQSPEMEFREMIDKRNSVNEDEMKFNEMMDKRTSLNDREMR